MEKLEWRDEYNIHPVIDEQHKRFFEISNKLLEFDSAEFDLENFITIITELTEFTEEHFAYEENLLQKIGYKHLAHHLDQHHEFIEKLSEILEKVMMGEDEAVFILVSVVNLWWIDHILHEDMQYKEFVQNIL